MGKLKPGGQGAPKATKWAPRQSWSGRGSFCCMPPSPPRPTPAGAPPPLPRAHRCWTGPRAGPMSAHQASWYCSSATLDPWGCRLAHAVRGGGPAAWPSGVPVAMVPTQAPAVQASSVPAVPLQALTLQRHCDHNSQQVVPGLLPPRASRGYAHPQALAPHHRGRWQSQDPCLGPGRDGVSQVPCRVAGRQPRCNTSRALWGSTGEGSPGPTAWPSIAGLRWRPQW